MIPPSTPYVQVVTGRFFLLPFLFAAFVNFGSFFLLPRLIPGHFKLLKQRAWILTAVASGFLSLASIPFVYTFFLPSSESLATTPLINSAFATAVCGAFASYCLCDLLLGTIYYRSHVDPFSGYLHHSIYAWMVTALCVHHVPGGFCTLAILELPTFIMSLGQINKKLRNDSLFGVTFFATRIVFHTYMVFEIRRAFPGRSLYWFLLAGLPVHLMWFRGWVVQQIRLRKRKEKVPEEIHVAAVATTVTDVKEIIHKVAHITDAEIRFKSSTWPRRLRTGSSLLELELDRLAESLAVAPVMVGPA